MGNPAYFESLGSRVRRALLNLFVKSLSEANTILDGTDAVMLFGESAIGKYPEEAVAMLAKIAAYTESQRPPSTPGGTALPLAARPAEYCRRRHCLHRENHFGYRPMRGGVRPHTNRHDREHDLPLESIAMDCRAKP